jgi:hypothetical protein
LDTKPALWKRGRGGAKAGAEIKSMLMCLFTRLLCREKQLFSLEGRPPSPLSFFIPVRNQLGAALNIRVKGYIKAKPLSSGNCAQKVTEPVLASKQFELNFLYLKWTRI